MSASVDADIMAVLPFRKRDTAVMSALMEALRKLVYMRAIIKWECLLIGK